MTLFSGAGALTVPAQAREVYDVSGAGDTVIATLGAHARRRRADARRRARRQRGGGRRRGQARHRRRPSGRTRLNAQARTMRGARSAPLRRRRAGSEADAAPRRHASDARPMAKAKTIFSCTECGGAAPKWQGQCPHCGAWNTLVETVATPAATRFESVAGARSAITSLAAVTPARIRAFRPASRSSTACWAAASSRAASC